MLPKCLSCFFRSEYGAVTVDLIVLTAALVSLGLATATTLYGGIANSNNIAVTQMEQTAPIALGCISAGCEN